ncbi:SPOR domain-containing protein [Nitrosovibrio sp. Nv17]|jgi:DedD protein|uniref:SPOR domain-containing protein n=1 Tax=Nitrosovibrio sp. Nv17 TaxID=1855339 RepID=UPI000908EDC0|nr:SPOR domain-containing protein [Nitrosovibrio sp. Nv17]SFW21965.1 DedD protein [Nitrosovibrio sp. Nv17]
MAKAVNEEELQLRKRARRRLVGAVALVLVAIVILPMILDNQPARRSQEIDIRIPAEDAVEELRSSVVPDGGANAPETGEVRDGEQAAAAPAGAPVDASRSRPPATERKAPPAAGAAPPAAAGAFVVQLGAFSDPAKARQQQQKLAAGGHKVYTETFQGGKGEMTRVRAGPFPTREEAEGVREKLKKLGLDGVVTEK